MAVSLTNLNNIPDPRSLDYEQLKMYAQMQAQQMQQWNNVALQPQQPTQNPTTVTYTLNPDGTIAPRPQTTVGWTVETNFAYGVPIDPINRETKRVFDDLRYSVERGVDSSRLKKFLRGIKSQATAV